MILKGLGKLEAENSKVVSLGQPIFNFHKF